MFLGIESFIALLFVDAFKNWVNAVPYFVKLTLGVVCVHPGHVGMCECCEGVDVFWGEVCDVVDDTGVVVAGEARSVGGELVVGELECVHTVEYRFCSSISQVRLVDIKCFDDVFVCFCISHDIVDWVVGVRCLSELFPSGACPEVFDCT